MGPYGPAVGGEIFAIAALANIGAAFLEFADFEMNAMGFGVIQCGLFGIE